MGLDDQAEKLRQAEEWATSPSASREQAASAVEFIRNTLQYTGRDDLRAKAYQILQKIQGANAVERL